MSYWFAFRVFDKDIDIEPRNAIFEGPFNSYAEADAKKKSIKGIDIQKTPIISAISKEEAMGKLNRETWMI